MPNRKIPRENCSVCGKETPRARYKYCSNSCQSVHRYQTYIANWKAGKEIGLIATGVVSGHIKKYLRIKYSDKCCLCGWSEINPKTGKVPLVADHVNGNWRDNSEENLRLLCPNCDSLSPTYAALNKGNGRKNRRLSKRYLEARGFLKNMPE